MEIYKGLPLRTIEVRDGIFIGVVTETVDRLVSFYLDNYEGFIDDEIEEFDSSYSYAVPENIFGFDDRDLIEYIKTEIDLEV